MATFTALHTYRGSIPNRTRLVDELVDAIASGADFATDDAGLEARADLRAELALLLAGGTHERILYDADGNPEQITTREPDGALYRHIPALVHAYGLAERWDGWIEEEGEWAG